jgi:hypothetical protein
VIGSAPVAARCGSLDVSPDARIVLHQLLEKPFLATLAHALDEPGNHRGPSNRFRSPGVTPACKAAGPAAEHVRNSLPAADDPIEAFVGGDKRTHLELPLESCTAMTPLSGFEDIFPIDVTDEYNSHQ